MSNSFRNLKRLEDGIHVSIPTDEDGLVGRECPNPDCLGYFKIKLGTGLAGENLPCHCPYCGDTEEQDHFWTQDQIEYARSIMMNEVSKALKVDVKEWDRELKRNTRNSFIKLGMEFKGQSHPIYQYEEKQLETKITCDYCTLEYSIYGLFAFCPDCGMHNSTQIFKKNIELVEKLIVLSIREKDSELAQILLVKSLETAVATFDGFGRSYCEAYAGRTSDPDKTRNISFQNLSKARTSFQKAFGNDFASSLSGDEWDSVVRLFQKRHLFSHKMGVVDESYKEITNDLQAIVGRKITITPDEIQKLILHLLRIAEIF
jgi:hypothetical protein